MGGAGGTTVCDYSTAGGGACVYYERDSVWQSLYIGPLDGTAGGEDSCIFDGPHWQRLQHGINPITVGAEM